MAYVVNYRESESLNYLLLGVQRRARLVFRDRDVRGYKEMPFCKR